MLENDGVAVPDPGSHRILFDSMNEGLAVVEVVRDARERPCDLRFLEANPAFLRQIGVALEQLVGRTIREMTPAGVFQERWAELCAEVARTGESLRFDEPRPGADRWFSIVLCRIADDRVAALITEITECKRAVEALRKSEELYRALTENMKDGVWILDAETMHFRYVSPAVQRLRGYTAEEITSAPLDYALVPGDRAYRIGLIRGLVEAYHRGEEPPDKFYTDEVEQPCKDGSTIWTEAIIRLCLNEETGHVELHGVTRDITARKRAEAALRESEERYHALADELQEADRRKNEFLGVLSHELRNPLATIQNSLQILDRADSDGEQAKRAKAVIARQFGHLARLVDDLLDLSRITQNRIKLQRTRIELNALIRQTLEDHRSVFEQKGVNLELEPAPKSIYVNADGARLAQVLGNLLLNAAKFTGRDGVVRVTVWADPNTKQAVIRLQDTGIGIAPELLPRLFQPFMQVDTRLDRSNGGLGLGLALSKSLIELHGGQIAASSAGAGQGTAFTVCLPLDDPPAWESPAVRMSDNPQRCRILVIEDHADLAESLRELLELNGHSVEIASSGPEGLAKACESDPEVLLCDIGLPGMDGYAVARAFQADKKLRKVFRVALTGYAQPADLRHAAEAGFHRHLAKPPEPGALERILAEARQSEYGE